MPKHKKLTSTERRLLASGNENANLWIRYYFPKRTDFSTITNEELKDVEWELNNRPRKRLGFMTPREVFDKHLNLP